MNCVKMIVLLFYHLDFLSLHFSQHIHFTTDIHLIKYDPRGITMPCWSLRTLALSLPPEEGETDTMGHVETDQETEINCESFLSSFINRGLKDFWLQWTGDHNFLASFSKWGCFFLFDFFFFIFCHFCLGTIHEALFLTWKCIQRTLPTALCLSCSTGTQILWFFIQFRPAGAKRPVSSIFTKSQAAPLQSSWQQTPVILLSGWLREKLPYI